MPSQDIDTGQWTKFGSIGEAKADAPEFVDGENIRSVPKSTDPLNPRDPFEDTREISEKSTEHHHHHEEKNDHNQGHRCAEERERSSARMGKVRTY